MDFRLDSTEQLFPGLWYPVPLSPLHGFLYRPLDYLQDLQATDAIRILGDLAAGTGQT